MEGKVVLWGMLLLLLAASLRAQEYTAGLLAGGTWQGPGMELQATAAEFAEGFPFILRFSAGYYTLDPGDPAAARKIFINDATNGTPEKNGHFVSMRLDFLYRVHWFGWQRLFLYGGPRRTFFTGNFAYIGGNEDFAVTSRSWGAGLGLEKWYAIRPDLDLLLSAGADYLVKSTLAGHDSEYAPNGETINGRNGYTYEEADQAIRQPALVPRLLIGAAYHF